MPCFTRSKHVIHAVGPIYESYDRDEAAALLAETYVSALRVAVQNDCTSIVRALRDSFISISCN